MWDTQRRRMWGGHTGRVLDILDRCVQTAEYVLVSEEKHSLLNSVQFQPKVSSGEVRTVKLNTWIGRLSSWFPSVDCLTLSLSCSRSSRGTVRREKSMVTRLVAELSGGARCSGSRGRGGTLTECLRVNLSLWWSLEVTEWGEGV